MNMWLDVEALRALIKARFAVKGQPTHFAAERGVLDETMSSFLRGRRPPADKLLAALGWERQIFYRRVEPCRCYTCTRDLVAANPLPAQQKPFGLIDPRYLRMFLCETCGNKRCPHAHDHRNACTASNEPGQPGSGYADASTPKGEKHG